MSSLVIRRRRPEDLEPTRALFQVCFGRSIEERTWSWKCATDPHGWSQVAELDGALVGHVGLDLRALHHARRPSTLHVAQAIDIMVAPRARGRGVATSILSALVDAAREGASFVLASPNSGSARASARTGFRLHARLRRYVRWLAPITTARALLDRAQRPPFDGSPARREGLLVRAWASGDRPRFDAYDELVAHLTPGARLARPAAELVTRFVEAPRPYRVLVATNGDDIVGHVVLRFDVGRLARATIVECRGVDRRIEAVLAEEAITRARRASIDELSTYATDERSALSWCRRGFVPTRHALPIERRVLDRRHERIALGDLGIGDVDVG